jgi:ATP-dependent RNA helicase RhlE
LAESLLKAVAEQGYVEPTPIQAQAIPVVLAGRDVMGGAQTGTGKTAGFTLPILQRLLRHANTSTSPARHPVRALILAPTRELAAQVEESVQAYGKHTNLRSTCVFGGVAIEPQMEALRRGVEILVATPGRLLDHVQQKTLNLGQVEAFVLDEADRMLDMGFIPDVKRIISLLPRERQSLLFSATFPDDIKRLADSLLRDPVSIQVARKNAVAELVQHRVHPVARERKRELLVHLVRTRKLEQVLVFTATRIGCNRLTYQLNREGVHAAAIHGDKTQAERMEALDAFKAGKVGILVATDVAARGLDIEELPCVLNFDLPNTPEDYVHRIGRTGRAGKEGEAISLVSPDEHERLAEIEKTIKRRIEREILAGFSLDGRDAATVMSGSRNGRGEGRDRDRARDRDRLTERRDRPRTERKGAPADPIFSKPYEPGLGLEQAKARAEPARPKTQVAALLGGGSVKR